MTIVLTLWLGIGIVAIFLADRWKVEDKQNCIFEINYWTGTDRPGASLSPYWMAPAMPTAGATAHAAADEDWGVRGSTEGNMA